jgi:hypothetical protein
MLRYPNIAAEVSRGEVLLESDAKVGGVGDLHVCACVGDDALGCVVAMWRSCAGAQRRAAAQGQVQHRATAS